MSGSPLALGEVGNAVIAVSLSLEGSCVLPCRPLEDLVTSCLSFHCQQHLLDAEESEGRPTNTDVGN